MTFSQYSGEHIGVKLLHNRPISYWPMGAAWQGYFHRGHKMIHWYIDGFDVDVGWHNLTICRHAGPSPPLQWLWWEPRMEAAHDIKAVGELCKYAIWWHHIAVNLQSSGHPFPSIQGIYIHRYINISGDIFSHWQNDGNLQTQPFYFPK